MFKVPKYDRVKTGLMGSDESYGNNGLFIYNSRWGKIQCIASDGMGWEHVSVSWPDRDPTWEQMCAVKHLFWGDEDCVIQFHPPKSKYVNNHPHCLHLWRPVNGKFPCPDSVLVGIKKAEVKDEEKDIKN